jgi:hydrogenase expression/formation protein HypC
MCWGVPGKVVEISGHTAIVDFGGVRKEVMVATKKISTNDLVMVHAGMVIGKLGLKDFLANVALYRDILAQNFLDSGLNETNARKKATDETNKLLDSFGIHHKEIK